MEEKNIEIAGKEVKRTDKVKFLGILIDDRLLFKNHVSRFQKNDSMAKGTLNRVSKLAPVEVQLKALIYTI